MMEILQGQVTFPTYTGVRCLMMPYVQGDPDSLPEYLHGYSEIVRKWFLKSGDIGFLTVDESEVSSGVPHRGQRAKFDRALHTEAGLVRGAASWGGPTWGGGINVTLDTDVRILLASSVDNSCAVWNSDHPNTSEDGDIGDFANDYPYDEGTLLRMGEVAKIGIFTPHESLPIKEHGVRQFLRIVSSGVHGREPYFTRNPRVNFQ